MRVKRRIFAILIIALLVAGAIFAGRAGIRSMKEEINISSWFHKKERMMAAFIPTRRPSIFGTLTIP